MNKINKLSINLQIPIYFDTLTFFCFTFYYSSVAYRVNNTINLIKTPAFWTTNTTAHLNYQHPPPPQTLFQVRSSLSCSVLLVSSIFWNLKKTLSFIFTSSDNHSSMLKFLFLCKQPNTFMISIITYEKN